jgi:ABC-type Zn uptake system ZnuABC Zn-binding protein ZnuA
MKNRFLSPLTLLVILCMILPSVTACSASTETATPENESDHEGEIPQFSPVALGAGEKLKAVATTSIVGDVVKNVGGEHVALTVLMPVGADPHTFEPTPQDIAAVSDAHVLFANGAGLEAFLEPMLESAGAGEKTVQVSHGIELLAFGGQTAGGNEHEDEHDHGGADPHTWTAPTNVIVWVRNIQRVLGELDPDNASAYAANAAAYEDQLTSLDAWVHEQVARIPPEKRYIVTDHQLFAYFAHAYGITQIGAVVPAYSTVAEPSARELADLEDTIRELEVKAIFVGSTVNPDLAQRVAEDTGTRLVSLYTGSLTAPGGDADNYLDYIRYNVNAIVNALEDG